MNKLTFSKNHVTFLHKIQNLPFKGFVPGSIVRHELDINKRIRMIVSTNSFVYLNVLWIYR